MYGHTSQKNRTGTSDFSVDSGPPVNEGSTLMVLVEQHYLPRHVAQQQCVGCEKFLGCLACSGCFSTAQSFLRPSHHKNETTLTKPFRLRPLRVW